MLLLVGRRLFGPESDDEGNCKVADSWSLFEILVDEKYLACLYKELPYTATEP